MGKTLLKLSLLGSVVAIVFSSTTAQLFGQDQSNAVPIVPLTYYVTEWRGSLGEYFMMHARRHDGSTVRVSFLRSEDGIPYEIRSITDIERERAFLLDTSVESVTTKVLPYGASDIALTIPCDFEPVPTTILGYDVVRRVGSEYSTGQGQRRTEALVAPELGCLVLEKRSILIAEDGTEHVDAIRRVVRVQLGEPASSLFDVPSNYTEMSPVEWLNARHGPAADFSNDPMARVFEQRYQEQSPQ